VSSVNLPPLPPVGGETTGRNVIDVLAGQHRELVELCDRLAAEPADKRLAGVVIAQLSRHLSAEEQYLYPAVRAAVPGGGELADRELAEDNALLLLLKQLEKGLAEAAAVAEAVRRHVAEEAAPTRPHPGTPSAPPWNKIVDPAVAVVDKLRDVVTGRTTYPRDL
jgi:hypothetical protein